MIAAHLGAAVITLFAVPMAGLGLIQLSSMVHGLAWATDLGIFSIILATSALSAWMFILPGALAHWGLMRLGLRLPLIGPILGTAVGLGLGLGEGSDSGVAATLALLGAIYGTAYQLILRVLWAGKAETAR